MTTGAIFPLLAESARRTGHSVAHVEHRSKVVTVLRAAPCGSLMAKIGEQGPVYEAKLDKGAGPPINVVASGVELLEEVWSRAACDMHMHLRR